MTRKRCKEHPGRGASIEVNGKGYCGICEAGQKAAAKLVDRHVDPKGCFVWYKGSDKWAAITGTGCAHWVAHQKNITHGRPVHLCLEGRTLRVSDVTRRRTKIADIKNVRVGDLWATKEHCGLVSKVTRGAGGKSNIEIQHCSSRQGRVAKNDFATYFKGKGSFFR